MKRLSIVFLALVFIVQPIPGFASVASDVSGLIVLDVENNGESWYVNPVDLRRYYLGRPDDAYEIMRSLGLGISNADLNRFDSDLALRQRLAGRIILQVEDVGQAYYVHPHTLERHYLGRAADAFNIMSSLGLGISSVDLARISIAGRANPAHTSDLVYISGVPFSAQAPFADWGDERQQEACEETSALMAMHWVNGDDSLSKDEALDTILKIANWEQETYGYHQDTSAADTVERIFKGWFGFSNLNLQYDISTNNIIGELSKGNLVIVPLYGSALGNPHYTGDVQRHMVLIVGYDGASNEFLLYDPGTRHGENIRFSQSALGGALRDYNSGVYGPIGSGRTAMITIYK
jgi:hypothetical protein